MTGPSFTAPNPEMGRDRIPQGLRKSRSPRTRRDQSASAKHLVVHRTGFTTDEPGTDGASIQAIHSELADGTVRNRVIAADIADAHRRGRCSLALTNRIEHVFRSLSTQPTARPAPVREHIAATGSEPRRDQLIARMSCITRPHWPTVISYSTVRPIIVSDNLPRSTGSIAESTAGGPSGGTTHATTATRADFRSRHLAAHGAHSACRPPQRLRCP